MTVVHRITKLVCGGCGHEQRCRFTITDDGEVPPDCVVCGTSDSWLALPRIDQRKVEAELLADTTSAPWFYGDIFGWPFGAPGSFGPGGLFGPSNPVE